MIPQLFNHTFFFYCYIFNGELLPDGQDSLDGILIKHTPQH